MLATRAAGIVLPVFSLPGRQGIGTLGEAAFRFVDFLADAGQSYWQILPLGPTGYGDSPYQSCSTFAGNPYLIDLEALEQQGLLSSGDWSPALFSDHPDKIDYGALYAHRLEVLRRAFEKKKLPPDFDDFCAENQGWLPDYALFAAAKAYFHMAPLSDWPDKELTARKPEALRYYGQKLAKETRFHSFLQWLFWRQWDRLKAYAGQKNIAIIGDLPIYVSSDSVEVWVSPELFLLDHDGNPAAVAGVPPDYYSATGQLWGNPLYAWPVHKKTGYAWWLSRLAHTRRLFDVVRIDHFRGFDNYWEVPAGAPDASAGRWRMGPGLPFVKAVREAFPDLPLIAEDLGELGDEVRGFFQKTGLPGMNVLIYAFDVDGDSAYLPHNTPPGRVLYTSTHDSPTFVGWFFDEADDAQRVFAADYLRLREDEGLGWGAVKSVWASAAGLAMAPLPDVLGLGADARINTPATLGGNWSWRVRAEAFNPALAAQLRQVTETYRRAPRLPLP